MGQGVVKSTPEAITAIDNMKKTINGGLLENITTFVSHGDSLNPENFSGASADQFYAEWPDTKTALNTAVERLNDDERRRHDGEHQHPDRRRQRLTLPRSRRSGPSWPRRCGRTAGRGLVPLLRVHGVLDTSMISVGDYDLEHQIGAGASGTVWKAHRRGPVARVVALKRLRAGSGSADLARMRREATVLTELDHPHVVRVLEVLHDGDGVAIAMQYAPGGSLADLLAERGRLTPGQVVAVAAPVADALASAHRRGVLHGDVKPANILFTSDGEPLLTDFGVARTLGLVTSDQVSGTAEYLAPELLDGAQPDPRADVYSLGVVCYQALTGRPPYTGPVPLAVARAADAGVHEHLEEVAGVPEPLARVVERAMDRDPAQRFAVGRRDRPGAADDRPGGRGPGAGPGLDGAGLAPADVGRRASPRRSVRVRRAPSPTPRGAVAGGCPRRWWWPGWWPRAASPCCAGRFASDDDDGRRLRRGPSPPAEARRPGRARRRRRRRLHGRRRVPAPAPAERHRPAWS